MIPVSIRGRRLNMRGMHRWLWQAFCIVIVTYSMYKNPLVIIGVATVVFVCGGIGLTIFAYTCSRLSMPRNPSSVLPKVAADEPACEGFVLTAMGVLAQKILTIIDRKNVSMPQMSGIEAAPILKKIQRLWQKAP